MDESMTSNVSVVNHSLREATIDNIESDIETITIIDDDSDDNSSLLEPPPLIAETDYDYTNTQFCNTVFENNPPRILRVETVSEDNVQEQNKIHERSKDPPSLKVPCHTCKRLIPIEELAAHQSDCITGNSTEAPVLSNAFENTTQNCENASINETIPVNASLSNMKTYFQRSPRKFLLPATSTPITHNNKKFLDESTSRTEVGESLSVSTSNNANSLKVNVQYERTYFNTCRKRCSAISPKLNKTTEKTSERDKEIINSSQLAEQNNDSSHARQIAYYQKLLEIRSKSGNNNNKLSITITSDNTRCEEPRPGYNSDSDDDCVLLEDTTFSCSFCSYTTDKQRTLNDHERNHRRNNQAIFRCIYCGQKYTRHALYLHVQNVHPGQKFIINEECHIEKQKALSVHKNSVHQKSLVGYTHEKYVEMGPPELTPEDDISEETRKNVKTFSCPDCSYITTASSNIQRHQKLHQANVPILQCRQCDFRSTQIALAVHIKRNHKKRKQLNTSYTYGDYERAHNDEIPSLTPIYDSDRQEKLKLVVKCSKCHFRTNNHEDLNWHLKTSHSERGQYQCDKCSYKSDHIGDVKKHTLTHAKNPTVQCAQCEYKSTVGALKFHRKVCPSVRNNSQSTNGRAIELYKCDQCSFQSTDLRGVTRHIVSHKRQSKKPSRVPMLQETVNPARDDHPLHAIELDNTKVKSHKKPSDKMHYCDKCSYSTHRLNHLLNHLKVHNYQPTLQCALCDFKATKIALQLHKKVCARNADPSKVSKEIPSKPNPIVFKTKANQFKCTQCAYSTNLRIKLNIHLKKKHPGKDQPGSETYKCSKCTFTSQDSNLLQQHMQSHKSNIPIFQCAKCEFSGNMFAMRSHYLKSGHSPESKKLLNVSPHLVIHKKPEVEAIEVGQPAPEIVESMPQLEPVQEYSGPPYRCPHCSFVGTGLRNFKSHVDSHKRVPTITCKCGYKSTPSCLSRHSLTCSLIDIYGRNEVEPHAPVLDHEDNEDVKKKTTRKSLRRVRQRLRLISDDQSGTESEPVSGDERLVTKRTTRKSSRRSRRKLRLISNVESGTEAERVSGDERVKKSRKKPPQEKNESTSEKLLKCQDCSYLANNKISLAKHNWAHKRNFPMITCPVCPYKSTRNQVSFHVTKAHESVRVDCNKCSMTDMSVAELMSHMNTHNNDVPIDTCPHCEFRSTSSDLRKHISINHPINQAKAATNLNQPPNTSPVESPSVSPPKSLPLSTTSNATIKPLSMDQDLNKRTVIKRFSSNEQQNSSKRHCSKCSASFSSGSALSNHERTHTNNQPIRKCDKCEFRSTVAALKRHMTERKHLKSDGKIHEFICHLCAAGFLTASDLNRHLFEHKKSENLNRSQSVQATEGTVHSAENILPESPDFNCNMCSFSTPLRIKLNMHKRKRHSEHFTESYNSDEGQKAKKRKFNSVASKKTDPEKCKLCDYSTPIRRNIKRHESSHLKNNRPILQCVHCRFKGTEHMFYVHRTTCPNYANKGEEFQTPQKVALCCSKCSFTTYHPADLHVHELGCKGEVKAIKSINSVKTFKCDYCSFTSFWQYLIERHKQSHEVLNLPIKKCTKCDFKSTPNALSAHLKKCDA